MLEFDWVVRIKRDLILDDKELGDVNEKRSSRWRRVGGWREIKYDI